MGDFGALFSQGGTNSLGKVRDRFFSLRSGGCLADVLPRGDGLFA